MLKPTENDNLRTIGFEIRIKKKIENHNEKRKEKIIYV